ncbi:MAG: ABC transporter ATP-binding protein [Pseudorhodoplanes sp.]|uniref:ABC transporter ATP-binding protein n=1 Tax=Pseudorhodoplanes sp. TaxID=1934341 RepID=UPI003D0AB9C1
MRKTADIPVLAVEGISKAYGGVIANRDVSLAIEPGEVHGLIGPNGAGKTTLVSILSGEVRPDQGHVLLDGSDITGLNAPKRAKLGIRRSFQITSVFMGLTMIENVILACQAIRGGGFRLWRPIALDRGLREEAAQALELVGIDHLAYKVASELSHGERRHLELAMVLVGQPRLLLLDEPFAGMGAEETHEMVGRLRKIKGQQAILLIEHDLDAVFSLVDHLTVMVMGSPIATDRPDAIRKSAEVRAAYFGTKAVA